MSAITLVMVPSWSWSSELETSDLGESHRSGVDESLQQRGAALRPRVEQPAREAALQLDERPRAPDDVGRQRGVLPHEAAGEVDGGDRLVDRVGGHVLVEEVGR